MEPNKSRKISEYTKKDKEYIQLKSWLKTNRDGWELIDTKDYPAYVVISDKHMIGIIDNKVMVIKQMYIDSSYIYVKPLNEGELSFLRKKSF